MLAAAVALAPLPGAAALKTLALSADNVLAQTHSRALMITTSGTFRQLSGMLRYDPASGACAIDVTFMVSSLALPNAAIRAKTMSPEMLDPAQFPLEHYVASCQSGRLVGQLTMRGETHPFDMTVALRGAGALATLQATGVLDRYEWGIRGMPLLVGRTIRVTDEIALEGSLPR